MAQNKMKKSTNKKWVIALIVLLLIAIGGGTYWRLQIYRPASEVVKTAGGAPHKVTANVSATSPSPKKQPSGNNSQVISGGTDTNGQSTSSTNPSQWITSTSGDITVEQPIANATFQSGDVLSGTAKVSTVNFRLIDNSVGEVSEGTLNVVNGKFSGKINFTPHSSGGQLDVFSTAANGAELNEIQITVNF